MTTLSPLTRAALLLATSLAFVDLAVGGLITGQVAGAAVVALVAAQCLGLVPVVHRWTTRVPVGMAGVVMIAVSMPFTSSWLLLVAAFLLGLGWDSPTKGLAPLFSSVFLVLISSTRFPIDDHLWLLVAWGAASVTALVALRADGSVGSEGGTETTDARGGTTPAPSPARTPIAAGPPPFRQRSRTIRDVLGVGLAMAVVVPLFTALLSTSAAGPASRRGEASKTARAYWGFEEQLDTSVRGDLGDEIVMRVRADTPDFWRAQSFDRWDGRSWSRSSEAGRLLTGSVIVAPPGVGDARAADDTGAVPIEEFNQVFAIDRGGNDVVFGAYRLAVVDAPVDRLAWASDGSLRSNRAFGEGTIYSVTSFRPVVTADLLRVADPRVVAVPEAIQDRYLDSTALSPRAADLARTIAADAPTTYDAVRAMEAWLGANTTYSRDLAVLPEGADTIDHFLFEERRGFCEQIATTLALWLRAVGVPARVAAGYVPGDRNPFTGEWTVRERDAHAWVEVFFPGVGWQAFDPTAAVPLSGEADTEARSPIDAVIEALDAAVGWPVVVLMLLSGLGWAALTLVARRRLAEERSDPRAHAQRLAARLEAEGRRRELPRRPGQTLGEYAVDLRAGALPDDRLLVAVAAIEAALFSRDHQLPPGTEEVLDAVLADQPPAGRRPRGRSRQRR